MSSGPGLPGFWAHATTAADEVAVVDVDGTPWTFAALADAVDRLSLALPAAGAPPGGNIALLSRNRVEVLVVALAALQSGLYLTPVNSHLTAAEVAYILDDARPALLFVDELTGSVGADAAAQAGHPPTVVHLTSGRPGLSDLTAPPVAAPPPRRAGAIMLYTSGTSGRPKGVRQDLPDGPPEVLLAHSARLLERFGIDPGGHVGDGVHLVTSPLYHSAPLNNALAALHMGHRVVLLGRFDALASLQAVQAHRVTWTHVVPTMMKRWLDLGDTTRAGIDVSSLRWVIHAAAPCPPDVKRRMLEWLGPVVYEYYSSTEAGGTAIGPLEWLAHPGTVGRPWPGADIRILADDGTPLPVGQVGRVFIRIQRPFVYHGDPEQTAASRRGDYVTVGDLGSLDADGYLTIADRRTDLIISGGVNVYPAEIEAVLLEHPDVADAAVIGVPHPDLQQVVHAVIEPRPDRGGADLVDRLRRHCEALLGSHKRPRSYELRARLPRTETGKLLRRALREEHAGGDTSDPEGPAADRTRPD